MSHQKTINQLLDAFGQLTIDQMESNPKLGETRQRLIDRKQNHSKGGLLKVRSTYEILCMIEFAKTYDIETAEQQFIGQTADMYN